MIYCVEGCNNCAGYFGKLLDFILDKGIYIILGLTGIGMFFLMIYN